MLVAHFGDVHIRSYVRLEEYREQFNKLTTQLRKNGVDLIVCCGDWFDNKINLSPESVRFSCEAIEMLANVAPLYMIAGNHDANLSNLSRMDSLQLLGHLMRSNSKFHYLRDSGLFSVPDTNIEFGVFSQFDKPEEWPVHIENKDSNKCYIALHHAPLQGAKFGTGIKIEDGTSANIFSEYDMVWLADIHQRQFLNEEKTIAYPGSLIQQNFGEEVSKGYLIWDTDTKKSRYVELPNDYSFVSLRGDNPINIREQDTQNLTSKTRLKIVLKDKITRLEEIELRNFFSSKYKLEEAPIVVSGQNDFENYRETNKELWANYHNTGFQTELLENWLKGQTEHPEYSGKDFIENCVELHKRCMAQIEIPDYKNNRWKLVSLKFSGFGPYGDENYVNFNDVKGIAGLFAPNRQGKTTLIEVLTHAVTGETIKSINLDKFINLRRTKASSETLLEHNGTLYRILRQVSRKKTGGGSTSKIIITFQDKDGVWQPYNELDGPSTNKSCQTLFGDRDDFLLTSISSQENYAGILDKKDSERLAALYRFTNLDWFENLRKKSSEEIKDIEKEIMLLQKSANTQSFAILEQRRANTTREVEDFERQLSDRKRELEQLIETLIALKTQVKETTSSSNAEKIRNDLEHAKKSLRLAVSGLQESTNSKKAKISEMEKMKSKVQQVLKGVAYKEIIAMKDHVKKMEDERGQAQTSVKILSEKKNQIDMKLNILKIQPWVNEDPNCRQCMFLKDAWQAKDDAERIIQELSGFTDNLHVLVEELNKAGFTYREILTVNETVQTYMNLKSGVEKSDSDILRFESERTLAEKAVESLSKELEEHADTLREMVEQQEISTKVQTSNVRKQRLENEIQSIEKSVWNGKTELARIDGSIENMNERLRQVLALESKTKFYVAYQKAVSKNGVPLDIIRQILPKINLEVNQILSMTQNWKISIHVDNDKLNINIIDIVNEEEIGERPIECCSGAERTITAIALRVALTQISFLPRPTFMIIDEAFSALDDENLSRIELFLNEIKAYFDFILLISHIPQMQSQADCLLVINKTDDDYSQLRFGSD